MAPKPKKVNTTNINGIEKPILGVFFEKREKSGRRIFIVYVCLRNETILRKIS